MAVTVELGNKEDWKRLREKLAKTSEVISKAMKRAVNTIANKYKQNICHGEQTMAKKLEWAKTYHNVWESKCSRFEIKYIQPSRYILEDRDNYRHLPYETLQSAKKLAQRIINEEEKEMKKKKRYIKTNEEEIQKIAESVNDYPVKLYYVCRNRVNPIVDNQTPMEEFNGCCEDHGRHRVCGDWKDAHAELLRQINVHLTVLAFKEEDVLDELEAAERMKEPKEKKYKVVL